MQVDRIYYINCEHRKDRRESIENFLSQLNSDKVQRIEGVYIPENGSLGCVRSHLLILDDVIKNGYNNFLVFEDDFIPYDINIIDSVNKLFEENVDFDVVMLSCNLKKSVETKYDFLNKVIDGQTSSGYISNINFVDRLKNSFIESESKLEEGLHPDDCALDQNWKKLQETSNWYSFNPLLGRQMDGWSDIEKRDVNYKC